MDQVAEYLLSAPDSQLDARMRPYIKLWGSPPKAVEILEVLDYTIHGSLGSGFVVTLLQVMLDDALKREGTTLDAVVTRAAWREKLT